MSCSEKIQFVKFIVQPNQLVGIYITNSIAMELIVQIGQLVRILLVALVLQSVTNIHKSVLNSSRYNDLAKSNIEMLVYVIMLVQD